jgi:hypothetical protein
MKRAVCLLLTVSLCACATGRLKVGPAKGGEVVEVEGWSPYDKADLMGTKKRSLIEAQKKAVERVVGVFISAKTRVSKAVAVNQNILADVGGYIKKYDIVKEWQEDGFYKTRIRALVKYQKVGKDLRSAGLLRPPPPPGNPRILVLMADEGAKDFKRKGRASSSVRRGLLQQGFAVIDRNDDITYRSRKSTDAATAAKLGRELKADLVIRGEAEAYELKGLDLAGFHSFRARVSLEVLRPETGEVVASRVQEASGLDPAPAIAEGKALETAGLMAGEDLGSELSDLLRERVDVTVRVIGMTGLDNIQRLINDLRTQPDIASVTLNEYRNTGAELSVSTEGMPGDQLSALMLQMKTYRFLPSQVSPYLVELRLPE